MVQPPKKRSVSCFEKSFSDYIYTDYIHIKSYIYIDSHPSLFKGGGNFGESRWIRIQDIQDSAELPPSVTASQELLGLGFSLVPKEMVGDD